jgi:uncharacterized tellurite resistance protein B-like protein
MSNAILSKPRLFLSTIIPPSDAEDRAEHSLQLATAVLLIEVMRSDAECAEEEHAAIIGILKKRFALSDELAEQLAEHGEQTAKTATDFYQFTTVINRELTLPEKIRIVEYLWQVVYADGKVSAHENHLMRKLVDLLHISLGDNAAAKERARAAAGVK